MHPKKLAVYYQFEGPIEDQFPELRERAERCDRAAIQKWFDDHKFIGVLERSDPLPEWAKEFDLSEHYARVGGEPSSG